MRFLLILLAAAAAIAVGYHFSQSDAAVRAGFYRPLNASVSLIALGAIGLLASRTGDRAWLGAAIGFAAVMAAAALTPQGLRLPQEALLIVATLFALGLFGALNGAPGAATAAIALALGGLVHGHALSAGGGLSMGYLGGFALGAGAAILVGMALGQAADRLSGGASAKLAAGVAGIGLYLTLIHFRLL